jgi:hypothetical protein
MMHEGTLAQLQAATGLATLTEMFLSGLSRAGENPEEQTAAA